MLFLKTIRKQFKEDNRKTFGGAAKYAKNDDEKINLKYATNARIEKAVYKLVDEGEELALSLMNKLPTYVWKDVWEENWQNIIMEKWSLNLHGAKKLVTKRCFAVLDNMITNYALQPDDHEPGTCVFCGCELQDEDHENSCLKCE